MTAVADQAATRPPQHPTSKTTYAPAVGYGQSNPLSQVASALTVVFAVVFAAPIQGACALLGMLSLEGH